ncbi:MAG: dual specificity protein phosphatase family protein [Phycisphaera sp.]|nr:dual specificity protein phosphatase family protein [Phycisphaera sp.]
MTMSGVLFSCLVGCESGRSVPAAPSSTIGSEEPMAGVTGMPTPAAGYPMDAPGLENLVAYHPGFVSGSAPDGAEGLDTLASLGVRTIVSVDGAAPEVEAARERGMRYIHLPVGYDGFDDERRLQLVRGVLDGLEKGAVYIHCHHGMHRSAGAAAAVSVGAGWSSPEAAIERMRVSGTSPRYRGLYRCAAQSTRIDAELIESVDPDLPEVDRPDDFVELMIGMDLALEHLQLVAEAGWIPPVAHPDLVPAAEAGRLADLLRFASEGDRALQEPDARFAEWLGRQSLQVTRLEALLLATDADPSMLDRSLDAIRESCVACHAGHRD